MILGDLLDARVLDEHGRQLGHVVDVRLVVDLEEDVGDEREADREHAEPEEQPLADQVRRRDAVGAMTVMGLLVSPRTGSSFLGYERDRMRSPWLVAALVRRRHRGTFLVAWDQVASIEQGRVALAPGFERLDPTLDDDAEAIP